MAESGSYRIPLHEFSKAAILGDFSHYNPNSSLAASMFDAEYPDPRDHFLSPLIVGYLKSSYATKDKDGFTVAASIVGEATRCSSLSRRVEACLRRLTNKKLIETMQRVTFEEDVTGRVGELPLPRLTTIGAYHLDRW